MSETREVFTVIEDVDGEGQDLLARQPGVTDVVDSNHAGVVAFENADGTDAKGKLNANGSLQIVDENDSGAQASASANVTIAAKNVEQDVVSLTIANDEVIKASMAMGSGFQPMVWVLYHDDNSSLNELARFVTGSGDFSHLANLSGINFTAGATGTQRLVLRATQLRGKLTDAHGTISLNNFGV